MNDNNLKASGGNGSGQEPCPHITNPEWWKEVKTFLRFTHERYAGNNRTTFEETGKLYRCLSCGEKKELWEE